MGKKVFFSFHYDADHWRVNQIRNIGVVDGNKPFQMNEWEEVKRGGQKNIESWINKQLKDRLCTIVLVGKETAERPWVKYEIVESWNRGLGVFGLHIDRLKNQAGEYGERGGNPFSSLKFGDTPFDEIASMKKNSWFYDSSKEVYSWISENIDDWVDEAIEIRKRYYLR